MSNPIAIYDNIYGLMEFPADLKPVFNSEPVLRLLRLKQLGTLERVYPGGAGTRYVHSIGVGYLMARFISRIARAQDFESSLREKWEKVGICAGLLHDIGHGPFSHTFDRFIDGDHEARTILLTERLAKDPNMGSAGAILQLTTDVFRAAYESKQPLEHFRDQFEESEFAYFSLVARLLSGAFDLDKLDYLRRDAFHLGFGIHIADLDWLLSKVQFMTKEGNADRYTLCFPEDCCTALEEFLINRRAFYWKCLYHDKVMGLEQNFLKLFGMIKERPEVEKQLDLPRAVKGWRKLRTGEALTADELLSLDDGTAWSIIRQAHDAATSKEHRRKPIWKLIRLLSEPLIAGEPKFKTLYECGGNHIPISPEHSEKIRERVEGFVGRHSPGLWEYFYFQQPSNLQGYIRKEGRDIRIMHRNYPAGKSQYAKHKGSFGLMEGSTLLGSILKDEVVTRYYLYEFEDGFVDHVRTEVLGLKRD